MNGAFIRIAVIGIVAVVAGMIARPYVEDRFPAGGRPSANGPRGGLAEIERATIDLFDRVSPSVVMITCITIGDDASKSDIKSGIKTGSGFFWDTSGNIVTNAHVVQDANVITVWLASGEQVEAETVGSAPNYDIAVIRLNGRPIRSAFDLTDQLEDVGIGQSIRLTVKRDGKTVEVEVEIVDIDRKF